VEQFAYYGYRLTEKYGQKIQIGKRPYISILTTGSLWIWFGNRIKYSLAQEMTNRAILTQIANRTKSYKSAEVYLNYVKEQFPHALELQCIPDNQELWLLENYETFLEKRRALLAEHLNTFLSGITEIEETVSPVSIEDMIAQGESDELEFKATLRWDINNARINKKLEEVVLKTVAAFANSQGGTLLIGVDDEGQILGLDYDLQSLGNPDLDGFEIHLRNLLVQNFGVVFINNNMEIVFPNINYREVCQINVTPASYPVIIKVKDSNGQQVERLFVRSGNSSQEIPISQAQSYFNERFKK
jgi:hypothetical protein